MAVMGEKWRAEEQESRGSKKSRDWYGKQKGRGSRMIKG